METIMGIKGKDFVMLAADSTHPHSIFVLKSGNYCTNLAFLTNNEMIRQKNKKLKFNFAFR